MKTNRFSAAFVLFLAWAATAISGCCYGKHDACAACYGEGYPCFGYHSTCWRPWPEECPTCPSFAIMPPPQEQILKDVPMSHEPLPPAGPVPTPAPVPEPEQPAPIIEPEEGRRPSPQVRKVSKKRVRAVPTDNR